MLYSEVGSCKVGQEIVILGGRVTLVEEEVESSRSEKRQRQLAGVYQDRRSGRICSGKEQRENKTKFVLVITKRMICYYRSLQKCIGKNCFSSFHHD